MRLAVRGQQGPRRSLRAEARRQPRRREVARFFGAFGAAWDDAMVARWSANPMGMLWPQMVPGS